MVDLRPHIIRKKTIGKGYEDENGDWIQGEQSYSEPIECRYEPNGRANSITFADGTAYQYQYVVYMDADCPEFDLLETVELGNGKEMQVKGFHRGQLNAKLWL